MSIVRLFGDDEYDRVHARMDDVERTQFVGDSEVLHGIDRKGDDTIIAKEEEMDETSPTLELANLIYRPIKDVLAHHIGFKGPESLVEPSLIFTDLMMDNDDNIEQNYFASTSDRYIVEQGEYKIINYIDEVYKPSKTDREKGKAILKRFYSPNLVFWPAEELDDLSEQHIAKIHFPLVNSNTIYRLFNQKEKIAMEIKTTFNKLFTDLLIDDRYSVRLDHLEMRVEMGESGQFFIAFPNKKSQFYDLPGSLIITLSLVFTNEEMLNPESDYMKEVGEKWENKAGKKLQSKAEQK